jgi:hypothetical protein
VTTAATVLAPEIDPGAVLASLGYDEARDLVRVTGGWDTVLWRFQDAAGRLRALRLYWMPDREEAFRKEAAALGHCEAVGLPAPRIESLGRCGEWPVLVLTWLPGRPLLTEIERRPWRLPVLRPGEADGRSAGPPPRHAAAGRVPGRRAGVLDAHHRARLRIPRR